MSSYGGIILGTKKRARRPLAKVVTVAEHGVGALAKKAEARVRPHETVVRPTSVSVQETPGLSAQETPSIVVTPTQRVVRRPRPEVVPLPPLPRMVNRRPLLEPEAVTERPPRVRARPLLQEVETTRNIAETTDVNYSPSLSETLNRIRNFRYAPTTSRIINNVRSQRYAPSTSRSVIQNRALAYAPETTEVYQPSVTQSRSASASRTYAPGYTLTDTFTASASGNVDPVLDYVLGYSPERNIPLLFLPPAYPSIQGENVSPETEISIEPKTAVVVSQTPRPMIKSDVYAKQFLATLLELG